MTNDHKKNQRKTIRHSLRNRTDSLLGGGNGFWVFIYIRSYVKKAFSTPWPHHFQNSRPSSTIEQTVPYLSHCEEILEAEVWERRTMLDNDFNEQSSQTQHKAHLNTLTLSSLSSKTMLCCAFQRSLWTCIVEKIWKCPKSQPSLTKVFGFRFQDHGITQKVVKRTMAPTVLCHHNQQFAS